MRVSLPNLAYVEFLCQFSNVFQVGDFVLAELPLEKGRNAGTLVCYVAKVMEVLQEEGKVKLSFLRMKSCGMKDTFTFPPNEDVQVYDRDVLKGGLATNRGATKRQSDLVKVYPPLLAFNMHF